MSSTRGQSAWIKQNINKKFVYNFFTHYSNKKRIKNFNPSETKHSAFYSSLNQIDFNDWLVGVTDRYGTFYFNKNKKGVWSFTFKIGQSNYNLRLLFYVKSMLGVGSVSIPDSKDNTAEFRVRNIQHIIQHILPIFDKCTLLTSKHYSYFLFREAILIASNKEISKEAKEILISELKMKQLKGIPLDYVSPAWDIIGYSVNSVQEALKVLSKSWLIGFTESEGSFYIVKKGPRRLVHAFEITQKLDIIILKAIAYIFQTKVIRKKTYNTVVVSTLTKVQHIISYFNNTMKGMKPLEFRIWARSFNSLEKDFNYLLNIQKLMRNIRSIRLDKNFKIK